MQKKKGVSLIVLVITIIVMIILAAAIMISLENTGIFDKANEAVDVSNLKELQHIAALKWAELYRTGKSDAEIKQVITNTLIQAGVDTSKYIVNVTASGADVTAGQNNKWVLATVDGVPIPKGFVSSPYAGEKTKADGLVIYELNPNETAIPSTETQHTSKTTRNQYVWVPVETFSDFVRQNFGNSFTISNSIATNFWEVILNTTTNMPDVASNTAKTAYMTPETLAEVQAMYESVKEYKGFYIARYEAGLNVGSHKTGNTGGIIKDVHSKMNKAPYNHIPWTANNKMNEDTNGAVEVARSLYPKTNANYGVVSTLTYGVQWDSTLAWWIKTEAKNGMGDVTISSTTINDSTKYGNYYNNNIAYESFNTGAKYLLYSNNTLATAYEEVKTAKTSAYWLLTTGASEETKVKNIYDMAGNLREWTMEGESTGKHVGRGGFFRNHGTTPVSHRFGDDTNIIVSDLGFRSALYIKK